MSDDGDLDVLTENPLPDRLQRRNSLVFMVNTSLSYFVAPVFYVGVLHAAICASLNTSDTLANLPQAVFMCMTPFPVLIAWIWPSPRLSRRILLISYAAIALAGGVAAVCFIMAPRPWVIAVLTLHAACTGVTNGVISMCLWELIGRGMTPSRRAWTLSCTFGAGPIFAVLGSCASQLILSGDFLGWIRVPPVPQPWSYAVLFGTTLPVMSLAGVMVLLARLPDAMSDAHAQAAHIFQGIRLYVMHPLIPFAAIAFLLTYAGSSMLVNNMTLYIREATGVSPEARSGLQLILLFGFKSLAGFALGWMAARLHPKAPVIATTSTCLLAILWAFLIPGPWYMLCFGFLGAGELFYVYYMNYIVGCSPPDRIREFTAYTSLITVSIGLMPLVYGWVSDHHGLRASFLIAAVILTTAVSITLLRLPKSPFPNMR